MLAVFAALPSAGMKTDLDGFLQKSCNMPADRYPGASQFWVKIYATATSPELQALMSGPAQAATPVSAGTPASAAAPMPSPAVQLRVNVVRGNHLTPGRPRGVKLNGSVEEMRSALAAAAGLSSAANLIVTDSDGDVVSVPSGLVGDKTYFVDELLL